MEVATTPPKKHERQFIVLRQLFRQVPTVDEALQHGTVWKFVDGRLDDVGADPRKVPSKRLAELVERGELFGFWGQRLDARPDVDPDWHKPVPTNSPTTDGN